MEILADAMPGRPPSRGRPTGWSTSSRCSGCSPSRWSTPSWTRRDQLCGEANSRNGYRNRTLETCVGTLNLRIPKLRTGSFFPRTSSSATSASTARSSRRWPNVRHRHQHQEGAEDSREDGHREARQGPSERDRRDPRRRDSRPRGGADARAIPYSGSTRPTSSAAAGAAWLRPRWSRR